MLELIFVHFVADFHLQRRHVAVNKSSNWLALAEHVAIIFVMFLWWGWPFALANACIHGLIDRFVWTGYKWLRSDEHADFKYWEDHFFYMTIGFDQFLHVATLIILMERL